MEATLPDEDWLAGDDDDRRASVGRLISSERKCRLFAVACCRLRWGDFTLLDCELVEAAEAFADNRITVRALQEKRREAFRANNIRWHPPDHRNQPDWKDCWAAYHTAVPTIRPPSYGFFHTGTEVGLGLARDSFANPFRPVTFDPTWRTSTAVAIAQTMYGSRNFSAMPILADALEDAGCDHAEIIEHCRGPGPHVRGCWVVDLVLGKS